MPEAGMAFSHKEQFHRYLTMKFQKICQERDYKETKILSRGNKYCNNLHNRKSFGRENLNKRLLRRLLGVNILASIYLMKSLINN